MLIVDQSSLIDIFSSSLPYPVVLMQVINSEMALLIYTVPVSSLSLHFKEKKKKLSLLYPFLTQCLECCLPHYRYWMNV